MKKQNIKKVLIITPSLDPKENISGISTITNIVIEENKEFQYIPFFVGKKDNEKRGIAWLFNLLFMPFRLLFFEINNIDIVHFNLSFEPKSLIRDFFLLKIIALRSIPVILHIHGGRFMNRPADGVYKKIIGSFLRKAERIIVLSDREKSFLLDNYNSLNKEAVVIIPNAIILPDYNISEKNYLSTLSILFLGRVDKAKGLDKISKSLFFLKEKGVDFDFYLCGIGPDKNWFLNMFPLDILDRIHDEGLVYGETKCTLLKKAHVFLLPSDFEGLPLALLECMSNYIVPVVSPVGSIPNVVNETNGRIVTNVEEITEAIIDLNNDRSTLISLAEMSRETVEEKYSVFSFIQRLNEVYLFVLGLH